MKKTLLREWLENAKAKVENLLGIANSIEATTGADGVAWLQLTPMGDFAHARGMTQRVDTVALENIAANFEVARRQKGKRFVGSPVFVGHPDVPQRAAEFPDRKAYGWVQGVEARADGLYGQVKWSEEGKKLVENGHYKFFSPYWGAEEIGRLNSTKLVRPVELVSVGLTNDPNIPTLPLSNSKDKNMELLATLVALLKLENDANEEKVTNRIKELQASAERVTTVENEKKKVAEDLTAERQAHQQTKTTLENSVKTERKERITVLLDNAIGDGRITAAQRPQWAQELENSFDGKVKELSTLKPVIKTRSVTGDQGNRRIQIENQQERTAKIQSLVAVKMKDGLDYDQAFNQVRIENVSLFEQMQQPASK